MRFGLDSRDFLRFAYSKAISRPDIGLLRNFVQINSPVINTSPDSPYVVYNSPTAAHIPANVVGYNFVFQANAGNVGLKPISADQFDISFERYMNPVSSFTVDGFYKRLTDLISYGQSLRSFTNNGSTQTVQVNGPINSSGVGKLYGLEANFQTFFTFLPGLLSGLGMQLNYTYVHQSGINNSNVINATSGGDVGAIGVGIPALGGTGNVIELPPARRHLEAYGERGRTVRERAARGARRLQLALALSDAKPRLLHRPARVSKGGRIPRWLDPLFTDAVHGIVDRRHQLLGNHDYVPAGNLWQIPRRHPAPSRSTWIPHGAVSIEAYSLAFA